MLDDVLSIAASTLAVVILAAAPILMGCDEGLGSREGADRPFTIYGVFTPDHDTQSVLVYPIEDFPSQGSPEPLDANVYSINLSTGERTMWRDSVLAHTDSSFTHAYWAPFRADHGERYRLVVERSDGAASSVEVQVPEPVSISLLDESNAGRVRIGVEGADTRLLTPEIKYRVYKLERNRREYTISYAGSEVQEADGWHITINMVRDATQINFLYNGQEMTLGGICREDFVILESLRLRAIIGDPVWEPPDGILDPDLISNPVAMSNVENGYGFVGAGYRIDELLCPSEELVAGSCMLDGLDCRRE